MSEIIVNDKRTVKDLIEQETESEKKDDKIYNYAGMFADIVLHIETELTNQLVEHPWNAKVRLIGQDDNEIVEFYDVEVPESDRTKLGINVSHTIQFAKYPSDQPDQFNYIERINLIVNDDLYGNLTHVSSKEVFDRAFEIAKRDESK